MGAKSKGAQVDSPKESEDRVGTMKGLTRTQMRSGVWGRLESEEWSVAKEARAKHHSGEGKPGRAAAVRYSERNQNPTTGKEAALSCFVRRDQVERRKAASPDNDKKCRWQLLSGTGSGPRGHRC